MADMTDLAFLYLVFGLYSTQAVDPNCGSVQHLTQNNGVIISHSGIEAGHHYGKNQSCTWTIEAPEGLYVELVATIFDIEGGTFCTFDWLEVFDGNSTTSPSLGKFCGQSFNPLSSTQRFLTLHFVTDTSTQQTGFKLIFNFTQTHLIFCPVDQFQCTSGKCIENRYRCDNDDDCGDDSDELNCTISSAGSSGRACQTNEFHCSDGTCILQQWLCDGDDDCDDQSDESPQNCHGIHTG